ncbi:biotin-dependent carboxyltransferase family protein [Pseudomonas aeruginosa]|uniref:biotin-dependent carboxyltransferase family protein n=1 Tax=Pseudomonas aeruginosa TaxID=287 RepID=UPI000620CDC7|nr:biotin-dependent carboxyltransferase family protein [Pseudomonas aeruginosa]AKE70128.1 hypothetical protein YQ19_18475 [Pseudomonas aeruginosa]
MNDSIHGGLRVCQSTPLVQLQDRGRFGCRHLGVTQGGALDWLSMGWANWLLGNPLDAAVIEIALGGFVAECHADGWLADGARPRALPLPSERIMDCTGEARLELILGAQIGDFPAMSLFDAFNGDWQVDTRADRMGVRLLGPRLECRQQSMISEGIALGAVQVPPDGQPIVLLNDRQTIGGYPRLGALAPLALARLAQCLPGQRVRLLPTVQEAAHREHRRLLAAWDA